MIHDDDEELAVGSGESGMYLCMRYSQQADRFLVDWDKPIDESHRLVVGQPGTYPACFIFDFDTVLRSARTYAETGTLDESLTWDG